MTSNRNDILADVLRQAGFAGAIRVPLAGDASTRRYERLQRQGRTAILMDAEPRAETAPCPPAATPLERAALGYNAEARLAASRVEAFVAIGRRLASYGLAAPEIYAFDISGGFAVLEDFGEGLYFDLLGRGAAPEPLYSAAIDALVALHDHPAPAKLPAGEAAWPLLAYDSVALHAEIALCLDWFLPHGLNTTVSEDARAEWIALWDRLFAELSDQRVVMVLRDFHSPNLMWLPERAGAQKAGLLDFQDALAGSPAYDLVSLLLDPRRDVAPDFAERMLSAYIARAGVVDEEGLRRAFAILAAQRNTRLVGTFTRLAKRDGKTGYLQHMPRIFRYLEAALREPAVAPVANWFRRYAPVESWSAAGPQSGAAA